jgi:hypothetical protein
MVTPALMPCQRFACFSLLIVCCLIDNRGKCAPLALELGFARRRSGWALGLILLIVLVLGSEMIGLGSAQTPVGLGVGAGVGLLQSRELRGLLPNARSWTFASIAGHLVPFLAYDLAQAAGVRVPYSLHICVALSGVICGVLQARLLQRWLAQAWWWLPATILGWTLAAGSAAIADQSPRALSLRGLSGAAVYLALCPEVRSLDSLQAWWLCVCRGAREPLSMPPKRKQLMVDTKYFA